MDTYTASLHADTLSKKLLTAHAHSASEADPIWEVHDLTLALEAFDKLSATIPSVRARLSSLKTPAEEAA